MWDEAAKSSESPPSGSLRCMVTGRRSAAGPARRKPSGSTRIRKVTCEEPARVLHCAGSLLRWGNVIHSLGAAAIGGLGAGAAGVPGCPGVGVVFEGWRPPMPAPSHHYQSSPSSRSRPRPRSRSCSTRRQPLLTHAFTRNPLPGPGRSWSRWLHSGRRSAPRVAHRSRRLRGPG